MTLEKFKELFISEAAYDFLNRDFEWIHIDSCVYHIGEEFFLDKYTTVADIREMTLKLFIYRMEQVFIHQNTEELRKFLRKPSKPRKRLTKGAIKADENARKYYNLQ